MTFVKRGRFEIIYEILSFCRKPVTKRRIIGGCNLNHELLERYLKYLIPSDLLSSFEKNGRQFFQVTEKGKQFLEKYQRLENLATRGSEVN